MEDVEVNVAGIKMTIDFKVIEIMGDKDPYLYLLGIDWVYDNYVVIDLRRDTMMFEADGYKVVQPLDSYLGPIYTKLVGHNTDLEVLNQLYTITVGTRPCYINPTTNGSVSWRSIQSVDDDLKLDFDSRKKGSYEIFSIRCAIIMETRWIGTKIRNHPAYDGTSYLDNFLTYINRNVALDKRISGFDIDLKDTPARWWATHRALNMDWEDEKRDI
jgi:hypothetical protein